MDCAVISATQGPLDRARSGGDRHDGVRGLVLSDSHTGKADVHIPFLLSASTGIYVVVLMWCTMYVNFINGVGKIRLRLWGAVTTALLVIPLEVVFAKFFAMGTAGVSLGMALSLLPWCFVWPAQVRKILRGTARGIWNK